VGNFSNDGQEWRPKATPEKTLIHDFPDEELGKAVPMGSMMWATIKVGSALESIMTRRSLLPTASYPGEAHGL